MADLGPTAVISAETPAASAVLRMWCRFRGAGRKTLTAANLKHRACKPVFPSSICYVLYVLYVFESVVKGGDVTCEAFRHNRACLVAVPGTVMPVRADVPLWQRRTIKAQPFRDNGEIRRKRLEAAYEIDGNAAIGPTDIVDLVEREALPRATIKYLISAALYELVEAGSLLHDLVP